MNQKLSLSARYLDDTTLSLKAKGLIQRFQRCPLFVGGLLDTAVGQQRRQPLR